MAIDTDPGELLDDAALGELLAFPARHLAELPADIRFELELHGIPERIVVTTEPSPSAQPSAARWGPDELLALVIGTEAERLWASDVRGLYLRKRRDPGFRITLEEALSGAQPESCEPYTLGQVLEALGLRLTRAHLLPTAQEAPLVDPTAAVRAA